MQVTVKVKLDQPPDSEPSPFRLKRAAARTREGLTHQFAPESNPRLKRTQLAVLSAVIFFSSICGRALQWQDNHFEIVAGRTALSGVFNRYQKEAQRMIEE